MKAEYKIFEELDLTEKSVLEVGCGDGRISEFFAERCKNFQGVDLDKEAISKAKNRTGKGKFLVADGQDLPFENAKFDLVLFSKSLHHLKQYLALKEAAHVVKPGGEIIIIEPVIDTEYQEVLKPLQDERKNILMTVRAIVDSGLKIVSKRVVRSPKKFIDFNNLLNELDQSFNVENKVKLRNDIRLTLGEKVDGKPLVLDAKLNIYRVKMI